MTTEVSNGASIRGIVPPMATPLAGPDELDIAGLERLIEHILEGGVHGLFVLGTTGEGPALSYRLRRELVQRVCRQVGGRVPVLVGITDSAYPEMVQMAECAAASGATAVVMAPPFYFQLSDEDVFRLVDSLASTSTLPVYLYNQPQLTKVSFSPEIVERAAELPNIAGLKDSSGDIVYLKEVIGRVRARSGFTVLVGPEHLLEEALHCGAHGGVPGGANIFPDLPVRLYQACLEGNDVVAEEIQKRIVAIGSPIWTNSEAGPGYLRRLKCALNLLGLCSAQPAWPYVESNPEEREQIERHLRANGYLAG